MKKLVFFLIIAFCSTHCMADKLDESNNKKTIWCYAKYYVVSKEKGTMSVVYPWGTNAATDNEGNVLTFENEVAAICYMTLQGWRLVGTPLEGIHSGYNYSFVKEMTDAEATELLNQLKMNKKK